MANNEIDSFDQEIKYLEDKLGLSSSDSKAKKEVRRRLNKELKEDGFGDDIMSFLDQIDNVMDVDHLADAKNELSSEEVAALEAQLDPKKASKGKEEKKSKKSNGGNKGTVDLHQLEKEAEKIPDDIAEDDGVEDDFSDELVDSSYLRSFAAKNGLKVLNGDGEDESEMSGDELNADEDDVADEDLLASEDEGSVVNEDAADSDEGSVNAGEASNNEENENSEENDNNSKEENDNSEEEEDNNNSKEDNTTPKEVTYGSITDIYGRVLKGKEQELKQFTSKYVPPHLREGAAQEEKPELEEAMVKAVREVINKVTDESFITMCNVRTIPPRHH